MGYALFRIAKLKDQKSITDRYNHDMRVFDVANADPLRAAQNEELVDQLQGRTYADISEDEILRLQSIGANERKVRSDAVKGLDVFLGFSHEDADRIDIDEWKEKSVEWLRDTFNPPDGVIKYKNPDGVEVTEGIDNVKSVVLHMDEATPHIHAYVVPIDERGHLNAKAYTNGRNVFCQLQSSYAKKMECFGLARGEAHSLSRHEDITAYHNYLNKAVQATLPEPQKGESVLDYKERADEAHRTAMVHQRDRVVKEQREIAKSRSALYDKNKELSNRERILNNREEAIDPTKNKNLSKLAKVCGISDYSDSPERVLREATRIVKENKRFQEALLEHPDRNKAENTRDMYRDMINWKINKEKRKAKKQK